MAEIADFPDSSMTGTKSFGLMDFWNTLAPAAAARAAQEVLGNKPVTLNGGKPIATVGVAVSLPDWLKIGAIVAVLVAVWFMLRK